MIGERIRQARLLAGLTLEEVAIQMGALGQSITRAGLSKYETNKSVPKPAFLLLLARILNVKSSYFWDQTSITIEWIAFRKHAQLPVKQQDQIKAKAVKHAESYLWLQSILNKAEKPNFMKAQHLKSMTEVETLAEKVRKSWKLDVLPIDSMIQTIEDQGGIVATCRARDIKFDGLAGWVNNKFPLIVSNSAISNDRFRYNLAHELGHILIQNSTQSKETESYAHRFATAFLVPAKKVYEELGSKRRTLSFGELRLLKRKYGMSMQAWVRRAFDLGIVDAAEYRRQCIAFSSGGMKKNEPDDHPACEEPQKLKLMTLRALAEGMITKEKAEELCPGCIKEFETETIEGSMRKKKIKSPLEILKLPKTERDELLFAAAKKAEKEYIENSALTSFDAFGEDDLHDETR
jgi:Zn-dependent peptidase ImmA (M78 family)